jgi:hypothetical protein
MKRQNYIAPFIQVADYDTEMPIAASKFDATVDEQKVTPTEDDVFNGEFRSRRESIFGDSADDF